MKTKLLFAVLSIFLLTGCEEFREFDPLDVIETSYTGSILISESSNTKIDGEFNGTNDSGAYSFIWDNPADDATLSTNILGDSGLVEFSVVDSRGNQLLNATTSGESGFFIQGKKGKWAIQVTFSEFEGSGNFELDTTK